MERGAACFGNTKLSFTPILHAEWRPWRCFLSVQTENMPDNVLQCVPSPTEVGPSWCWCWACPPCCRDSPTDEWEPIQCWAFLHQAPHFLRPCHHFMCVESNYQKNARNKGSFFSLLIPLHLSFASVKWQRYAAAHKSEDVCCISHESCKCCVMSHILVECTRKQTVLLSELSLERGGREKAERFIQVRISKESTD